MGNACHCCSDETVSKDETKMEDRSWRQQDLADEKADFADLESPDMGTDGLAVISRVEFEPNGGPGSEFKMEVYKTTGKKLGVDVDPEDGETLLIDSLPGGGLFGQWNDFHPESCVKPGDRIIEVNGIRNDAMKMGEECSKDILMTIVIKRGP